MKVKLLFYFVLVFLLVFSFMPIGFLNASPGEIVINGDFQTGTADPWSGVSAIIDDNGFGNYFLNAQGAADAWSGMRQCINTSDPNFFVSYSVWPQGVAGGSENSYVYFQIYLYSLPDCMGGSSDSVTEAWDPLLPFTDWQTTKNRSFTEWWDNLHPGVPIPDFQSIAVQCYGRNASAWYDDISIVYEDAAPEPEPWVRTMPMTCWQVWINEDNNFQFIFWYPYKDENFVRIYDLEDNLVFETDLPWHDPNLIVDLPDGYYWVKTFHGLVLLQEFLIGKPGPEM